MARRCAPEIFVWFAISSISMPCDLAHLAEQRACEHRFGVDLAHQLLAQHGAFGGEGGVDGAALRGPVLFFLGEGRDVVGAAAQRVEQRVVRFLDARLLALQTLFAEQGGERETAGLVQLALALVGAAQLLVGGRAVRPQHVVQVGLERDERDRRRSSRACSRVVASASTRRAIRSRLRALLLVGLSMRRGRRRTTLSQTESSCSMWPT